MHESLERLFAYVTKKTAGSAQPIVDLAELRERLNISPAVFTNWKKRGVSKEGALVAEHKWGCSANWVLTGIGRPAAMAAWPFKKLTTEQVSSLNEKDLRTVENLALSLLEESQTPLSEIVSERNVKEESYKSEEVTWTLPLHIKQGRVSGKRVSDPAEAPTKRRGGAL